MNEETANYLLSLDKYFVEEGELLYSEEIVIAYPFRERFVLACPDDLEQNLFVEIWESDKMELRISMHHQDDNTQFGLLRIDFGSGHVNPQTATPDLPQRFYPYVGARITKPHIHYVVDGYRPLAWAVPLEEDDFPIKELTVRDGYADMLRAFFGLINVKTSLTFNTQMRIV